MRQTGPLARPLAIGLAMFVGLAPCVAAAENPPAAPKGPIAASAAAVVARTTPSALALAPQEASATATSDQPFLKTGKGKLAIALLAVATGYTIYSRIDKHVQSPGR